MSICAKFVFLNAKQENRHIFIIACTKELTFRRSAKTLKEKITKAKTTTTKTTTLKTTEYRTTKIKRTQTKTTLIIKIKSYIFFSIFSFSGPSLYLTVLFVG